MTRNILIPDEVRDIVGAQQAAEILEGPWPPGFRCPYCGHEDIFDDARPAVAGVRLGPPALVFFAHLACSKEGVLPDLVPGIPAPSELRAGEAFGLIGSSVDTGWPFVLIETAVAASSIEGPEPVDLAIAACIRQGMQPVGGLSHIPPHVPGWRVILPSTRRPGVVVEPGGRPFWAPMAAVPDGWPELAQRHGGRCGVYVVSRAGLKLIVAHGTDQDLAHAIALAGDRGRMAGVSADVRS
ncbi:MULTISPECIES: transposase [Asanoa]|uniref:Uncharacterized protein n=2 Tax=Asanoa TaxID=195964 RepID=A0A239PGF1_9ACTN|nr:MULTISPECIES: transposase [Asanoa]GIF74220.1 hypothetical protein Asi02nite_37380 [Asanoa siamensis]SNT66257.1 hypothetical protein SAMN05421812_1364 [Asanoa hainanensis]